MYNYGELKTNVATLVQRSGDADYKTKIGVWLNLGQDFLFNVYDYYTELKDKHNFTTVDEQEDYSMPLRFDKPLRVYDITNDKKLTIKTEEQYFDANIANIADGETGKPEFARIYGVKATITDISSLGNTVKAKSSSVSEDAATTVRVEGYINSDQTIIDFEDIVVSASDPTTYVSGTKTFYGIIHNSKSRDTTGYITIADSDGVVLAYIPSIVRVLRHKVMKLGLIPDGKYSMRVLFKKKITKMVDDNDYPFIDADSFLTYDAVGWAYAQEKEALERAATAWAKAKEMLTSLLTNQNAKLGPDYQQKITSMWASAHKL